MDFLFAHRYVPETGVAGLRKYKYVSADHSVLSAMMGPLWSSWVNLLPLWMAPNLVTLLGFIPNLIIWAWVIVADTELDGGLPQWAYGLFMLVVFFYQTMDALDGKQARRTGSSSPLGELFDHGCDAVTTAGFAVCMASGFGTGNSILFLTTLLLALVAFYMAQWEEHFTGVMEMGKLSVTEAQFLAMGVYLVTAVFGHGFWGTSLFSIGGQAFELQHGMLIFLSACACHACYCNIRRVAEVTKDKFPKALLELSFIASILFSLLVWIVYSPSNMRVVHSHWLYALAGWTFAQFAGRMVLSRVCHFSTDAWFVFPLPIYAGALAAVMGVSSATDVLLLRLATLIAIATYIHFGLSVIRELCEHLGIRCLHIPAPKTS